MSKMVWEGKSNPRKAFAEAGEKTPKLSYISSCRSRKVNFNIYPLAFALVEKKTPTIIFSLMRLDQLL